VKIIIESTTEMVTIVDLLPRSEGVTCRVWEGVTEGGIKVHVLIPRIAAEKDQDLSQFEKELTEMKPPSREAMRVFPLRMVL
jgi:hypothetical protein